MARADRVFVEASDEDSIATNSTALSDEQNTYNVHSILAEDPDHGGDGLYYLLRWEGYPLNRSTWEPPENISGDSLINQWEATKQQIREGKEQPFDLNHFQDELDQKWREHRVRVLRRRAKRRKRGELIAYSSDEEDPDARDGDGDGNAAPKRRKLVKAVDVKRKGRAQIARRASTRDEVSSSASDDEGEIEQPAESSRKPSGVLRSAAAAASGSNKPPPKKRTASNQKTAAAATSPPGRPTSRVAANSHTPIATVPSSSTAKRTTSTFDNWAAPKQRRQRVGVSDKTPKNSTDAKFTTLSVQGRYQKYGKNEPAPDPNALTFIDPKTGRPPVQKIVPDAARAPVPVPAITPEDSLAPTVAPALPTAPVPVPGVTRNEAPALPVVPISSNVPVSDPTTTLEDAPASTIAPNAPSAPVPTPVATRTGPEDIHEIYSRRGRTPPRTARRRSVTPPRAPTRPPQSTAKNGPSMPQSETCWHWLNNDCRYTAETCRFAHRVIDERDSPIAHRADSEAGRLRQEVSDKKRKTCHFWKRPEGCNKSEAECDFAHAWTGEDAGRPGTWRRGQAGVPPVADMQLANVPLPSHVMSPLTVAQSPATYSSADSRNASGLRRQSEAESDFAPAWTGEDGGTSDVPRRRQSDQSPLVRVQTNNVKSPPEVISRPAGAPNSISRSPPATGKKSMTCFYFWNRSTCSKSEDMCDYAHHDTGIYANEPRSKWDSAVQNVPSKVITSDPASVVPPSPQQPLAPLSLVDDAAAGLKGTSQRTVTPVSEHIAAILQIITDGDPIGHQLKCTLQSQSIVSFRDMMPAFTGDLSVKLNAMVTADDLRTYVLKDVNDVGRQPGGIVSPVRGAIDVADKVAELCRLNAAGIVAQNDTCLMVIYPSNAEEWKFLDNSNVATMGKSSLRFNLLPPMPAPESSEIAAPPTAPSLCEGPAVTAAEALLDLDAGRLLQDHSGRTIIKHVFLMMPNESDADFTLLLDYFQGLGCKVYHSGAPGAWSYFRERHGKISLVVLHPETPIWDIPGLHDLLFPSTSGMRVFSMGVHREFQILEMRPPTWECVRLFPQGTVTFITDDVLVYQPHKATTFIKNFLDLTSTKPPGGENSKIAMRPGVKLWVKKLAQDATGDHDPEDVRWLQLYQAVCKLCPPSDEDPDNPPHPVPSSHLISESPVGFPSFPGLWERDEDAATELMVQWFAVWSSCNTRTYRRFVVCHESRSGKLKTDEYGRLVHQIEADPHGWAKKYQHIGVTTPDDLMKKQKPRKVPTAA